MDEWKKISSQNDIDELLNFYVGFHDSCIVSASYRNGAFVDDKGSMHFGDSAQYEMLVMFHSQWKPAIEMRFCGLRQLHLTGWQNNYACDIFDVYLSFCDDVLPGKPSRVIVWADTESFNIKNINNTIHEPSDTYIVANDLSWRIVTNDNLPFNGETVKPKHSTVKANGV